eukprot:c18572_g1_i1.p1 GENE.c18572_g1_i1~~c18572_g1_i1.p1  ORF type:complete len:156 (-),score=18.06 c18572_g1_i1:92-559(-)
MAEAVSSALWTPIDVCKETAQVYGHKGVFRRILREEGLKGLYRGYFVTLASFGPYSALYFGLWEYFSKSTSLRDNTVVAAAASASTAAFLTNPVDVIKVRFQVNRNQFSSSWNMAKHIVQTEGLSALGRGTLARVIYHTPSATIGILVFEAVKAW